MAKYVIYRDDYDYPIEADTVEELRVLKVRGNWLFINHYYGDVCLELSTGKYFNIYTKEQVSCEEVGW